jgi:hypothetical protein
MSKKVIIVVLLGLALVLVFALVARQVILGGSSKAPTPTPTPEAVVQLTPDQLPKITLTFSSDAHYVTVDASNLHADQLEYNLIYDAIVKGSPIQTGVNAATKLVGKTTYSQKQLLGSESSGKFTYHTGIKNAVMELVLRDSSNRSVYSATYPFTVTSGKSLDLKPSE